MSSQPAARTIEDVDFRWRRRRSLDPSEPSWRRQACLVWSGREHGDLASVDSHDSGLHKVLAVGDFGASCMCRLMRFRVRRRNTVFWTGISAPVKRHPCQVVANLTVSRNSACEQRLYPIHSSDMPISNSAIVSSVVPRSEKRG
jgi:hypothetical protein